jgi:hypothetical protein
MDKASDKWRHNDERIHRQREEHRLHHQRMLEDYEQAAAPVETDLRQAGLQFKRLDDFASSRYPYDSRDAIPILLQWLPRVTHVGVKEVIVRAVTVKWAKPVAAPILIQEFLRADDSDMSGLKWAIGNALEVVADDSVYDSLVDIIQDKKHGSDRQMVVEALGNMKNPTAVDVLISVLDDEDVTGHAIVALGRLRAKAAKAKPYIEQLLEHPKAWVRSEAKRALAKIANAEMKAVKSR